MFTSVPEAIFHVAGVGLVAPATRLDVIRNFEAVRAEIVALSPHYGVVTLAVAAIDWLPARVTISGRHVRGVVIFQRFEHVLWFNTLPAVLTR